MVRRRYGAPPPQHALNSTRAIAVLLLRTSPVLSHTSMPPSLTHHQSNPLSATPRCNAPLCRRPNTSFTAYVVQHQRLVPDPSQSLSAPHRVPTKSNGTSNILFSIRYSLYYCLLYSHTNAYVVQHQHVHSAKNNNKDNNTQVDTISSAESAHTLVYVLTTALPMESLVFS